MINPHCFDPPYGKVDCYCGREPFDEVHSLAYLVACTRCNAQPREWCKFANGEQIPAHRERNRLAAIRFRDGELKA